MNLNNFNVLEVGWAFISGILFLKICQFIAADLKERKRQKAQWWRDQKEADRRNGEWWRAEIHKPKVFIRLYTKEGFVDTKPFEPTAHPPRTSKDEAEKFAKEFWTKELYKAGPEIYRVSVFTHLKILGEPTPGPVDALQ